MLKMTLNAFWWVAENIWKMTPPDPPPSPPKYGKFHMFFADTFWKLPLASPDNLSCFRASCVNGLSKSSSAACFNKIVGRCCCPKLVNTIDGDNIAKITVFIFCFFKLVLSKRQQHFCPSDRIYMITTFHKDISPESRCSKRSEWSHFIIFPNKSNCWWYQFSVVYWTRAAFLLWPQTHKCAVLCCGAFVKAAAGAGAHCLHRIIITMGCYCCYDEDVWNNMHTGRGLMQTASRVGNYLLFSNPAAVCVGPAPVW